MHYIVYKFVGLDWTKFKHTHCPAAAKTAVLRLFSPARVPEQEVMRSRNTPIQSWIKNSNRYPENSRPRGLEAVELGGFWITRVVARSVEYVWIYGSSGSAPPLTLQKKVVLNAASLQNGFLYCGFCVSLLNTHRNTQTTMHRYTHTHTHTWRNGVLLIGHLVRKTDGFTGWFENCCQRRTLRW